MKICPTCRRTYDDDGLNFCLEDGSVLTFSSMDSTAPTVVMNPPRQTSPSPGAAVPTSWEVPTADGPYSMQPKKKSSKAWLWVVAIFGVLILLCGGGFAGVFYYIASVANTNTIANGSKGTSNSTPSRSNTFSSKSPSPSPTPGSSGDSEQVDLADLMKHSNPAYGTTEFTDGELLMTSRDKGYYYVLVTPDNFKTDRAQTRLTVRNPDEGDSNLGYGLIFHSDPKPLENDYAFLIDSKRKRYRVVRHEPQDEITVTQWTSSPLIRDGDSENTLEARDKGAQIELYINGELATTITNKQGPKGGVAGLYSGDGVKAAFSKLEITK